MTDANRISPVEPNIKRLNRELNRRLRSAYAEVKKLYKAIPKTVTQVQEVKVNEVKNEYDITARDMNELGVEISAIFAEALEVQMPLMPELWWYKDFIEPPYRQGTFAEINKYNTLIETGQLQAPTLIQISPLAVALSPEYLERLQKIYARNYQIIKTLAEREAAASFQIINDAIDAGYGTRKTVRNIQERISVSFFNAARISRTEVGRAYNDGKLDTAKFIGEDTDLETGVMHLSALSPTTRANHAARHGKVYSVDQQRQWWDSGSNRINCFTPETVVEGRFKAGLKSFYSGKVCEFMTRDGRSLTVTPNHRIMTDFGLVRAAEITKGCNLLTYCANVDNHAGATDLNVDQVNTTIEQVFTSLDKVGDSSMIGVMGVDFNGDEKFIDENIQAVNVKSSLVFGNDVKLFKSLDYFKFKHADSFVVASSHVSLLFKRSFASTRRLIGMFGNFLSLLKCSGFISSFRTGLVTPSFNSTFVKNSLNDSPRNTEVKRKRLFALPPGVTFDEVVSVKVCDFIGHVYDLEEDSGLMLANGIIASNCKCTAETVYLDEPGLEEEVEAEQEKGKRFFDSVKDR